MPLLQRLLEKANHRFGSGQITEVDPGTLSAREPSSHLLADCAEAVGIKLTNEERDFVNRTPIALQEAIRGVSYSAVVRSRASAASNQPLAKVPITFAWMPSYDYELHITEARSTKSSWGGITVIIRGPYPS
jgi:hypothetical protein